MSVIGDADDILTSGSANTTPMEDEMSMRAPWSHLEGGVTGCKGWNQGMYNVMACIREMPNVLQEEVRRRPVVCGTIVNGMVREMTKCIDETAHVRFK